MSAPDNKNMKKARRALFLCALLAAWNISGCAPQAPVILPAAKINRLAVQNDPNAPNAPGGGNQSGDAQPAPEIDPFASAELSSKALLALASLPAASVQKLQNGDIGAPASTPSKCGFVAGDEDIAQKLSADADKSGWTAVAGQGNFFEGVAGKKFSDCRCLVAQYADKHKVFLVPVSSE
ncbi:MAG: hypothetical protein RL189_1287 [Pseudomonadota bacterium]|jgi:hypothetical protein